MVECKTIGCTNDANRGEICNTCYQREWNKKNPIRRAYRAHKANCKRRNIPTELTFEQFEKFAIETDYVRGRGKTSKSYTIDRIEKINPDGSVRGYDVNNIQVLTNGQNVRKKNYLEKYYDAEAKKMHWYVDKPQPFDNKTGVPF